ncbi:MAG: (Na+)-NQR maturation NqrM [Pseudomonadota bacterium]
MSEFLLAFGLLMLIVLGMSLGVILMGKKIKGSCGGLNAVTGSDRCVVCAKEIDPNSPLKERLQCPRAKKIAEQMAAEQTSA